MSKNGSNFSLSHSVRSQASTISLSFFMAVFIVLSVVGNILLIFAILRNHRLRSCFPNKLISSLAMSDFITAAFPLTYQLVTLIDVTLISNGGSLCIIGGLSAYVCFYVSVLTMVMLSVDRLIALGFPLQYSVRVTSKVRLMMLAYPWVHSGLFGVFSLVYTDIEFDWESMSCGFSWNKIPQGFTLYLLLFHVSIPFGLMFLLCSGTFYLVRRQNKMIFMRVIPSTKNAGESQARLRETRRASEIKLAKISIAIVFIFLISWSPYVVTRAFIAFAGTSFDTDTLAVAALVVYISLFSNPIIYSSLRADLRRQMLFCFTSRTSVNEMSSITRT